MNWNRVREVNRRASARKAKRERLDAEREAKVAALGGKFRIEELRAAEVRVIELKRQGVDIADPWAVWVLRGEEWVVWNDFVGEPFGMVRVSERFDADRGRATVVPFVSPAARRFAAARVEALFAG
jgi:hypothetical protein